MAEHDDITAGRSESREAQVAGPRLGLVLSTVALLLLACAAAYLGVVISLGLALIGLETGEGPSAFLSMFVYVLVAYAAPAALGLHRSRTRGWGLLRVLRFSASVSLAVNVALSPLGIAALSM